MADQQTPQDVGTTNPSAGVGTEPEYQKFIRPSDGKLLPLVTQSFQDPAHLEGPSGWLRLGIPSSRVPSLIHVNNWVWSATAKEGSRHCVLTPVSILLTLLKLIVAFPLMCFLMCNCEFSYTARWRMFSGYDAQYDPVKCKRDVPNSTQVGASRPYSHAPGRQSYLDPIRLQPTDPHDLSNPPDRTRSEQTRNASVFLPARFLCVVKDFDNYLFETINVQDYILEHGDDVDLEFVFVSYTRMHFRVATDEEIEGYEYPDEETREANKELAHRDRDILRRWGIDAAKKAGKTAFWIDFECVRDSDGVARAASGSDDVYRIGDVVRIAHSMIIALGPPAFNKVDAILSKQELPEILEYDPRNKAIWLKQWGSRLWTLPELLLCPNEYRIKLFVQGDPSEPKAMAKRNFASIAWNDAEAVNELVNHFEGSATLTQLNLIEAALTCFSRRGTVQYSGGDIAYAIMGLLPQGNRPKVDKKDSGFQAFAKLSFAGDSDAFLERLICVSPFSPYAPWYDTRDSWGTRLSNIHPTSQILGIGESDSVILNGVPGAAIQWDDIDCSVPFYDTFFNWMARHYHQVFMSIKWILSMNVMYIAIGNLPNWETFRALVVLAFSFAPVVGFFMYRSASKRPKARLIGLEGFVDPGTIEKHIYGFDQGRFALEPAPWHYQDNAEEQNRASRDGYPFTLVDTFTMTVTHFRAKSPPVAMVICAREGGLLRGVLCSYDWQSDTYCRQAVLRTSPKVLERMREVEELNLSLIERSSEKTANAHPEADQALKLEMGAKSQIWNVEVTYFWILWVATMIDMPALYFSDDQDHEDWRSVVYRNVAFLAVQLPACILLRFIPVQRILPHLATIKGFEQILKIVAHDVNFNYPNVLLFRGALDGILASLFITHTWSWYKPRELPLRLLIWTLLIRGRCLIETKIRQRRTVSIIFQHVSSLVCFWVGSRGSVSGPRDSPGLSGYENLVYAVQASAHKFESRSTITAWRVRGLWSVQYPLFLIMIGISLSTSIISARKSWNWNGTEEIIFFSTTIIIGIVLSIFPGVNMKTMMLFEFVTLICAIMSAVKLPARVVSCIALAMKLNSLILPLTWAMIVRVSSTWQEAMNNLSCTLAGIALGICITPHLRHLGFVIMFSAIKLVLVCLFSAYDYLGTKKSPLLEAQEELAEPHLPNNDEIEES